MEIDENKLKEILNEIEKEKPKIKRVDIYKTQNLFLGITAYTNNKGNLNVLLNIHTVRPQNSIAFPPEYIDELKEIITILDKNKNKLEVLDKFNEKRKGGKDKTIDVFKK
jgi:hypothetical protein